MFSKQLGDWLLLVGLLLCATLLMVTYNRPLMRTMRAEVLGVTAQVESSLAWIGRYVRVLEENDDLRRENIRLSSQVARTRALRQRNEELKRLLNLKDTSAASLRAARVLTKEIFQQNNLLTLDVGRADDVAEGMPVVHDEGIIGTVVLVNADYARVMPYLHTDFRVPGVILPLGAEGIVRWDGERLDRLQLEHVVKTEPVKAGQQVVTSGHSNVFPAGYRIGTVDSVGPRPGRNELQISLRPAVPLHEISHAFVILRAPDPDRQAFEQRPID